MYFTDAPSGKSKCIFKKSKANVVQLLSSGQSSLSFSIGQSLLKLMSIELVMPSNHLILRHPSLLLPAIFPSMRVFSNELFLLIRWPKYWSFCFSINPSNEYSGFISLDYYKYSIVISNKYSIVISHSLTPFKKKKEQNNNPWNTV